jgi:butyryl-CoA dehydrogenase
MSETLLSSRNLAFELYEVLDAEGLTQRERFAEHNRETFDAAIGTARSIAEKHFAPAQPQERRERAALRGR